MARNCNKVCAPFYLQNPSEAVWSMLRFNLIFSFLLGRPGQPYQTKSPWNTSTIWYPFHILFQWLQFVLPTYSYNTLFASLRTFVNGHQMLINLSLITYDNAKLFDKLGWTQNKIWLQVFALSLLRGSYFILRCICA